MGRRSRKSKQKKHKQSETETHYEKRTKTALDRIREVAKARGQEIKEYIPRQPEPPPVLTPPTPPVPKEPWVRSPLPPWMKRWAPVPDPLPIPEPTPAQPDSRQSVAKVVFALARLVTAGLLLWALARHPIGYYTALRLVTAGVCLYGAFTAGHDKQAGWAVLFWGMVALFQPFIPLAMTRQTWKYVDVIAAGILIASTLVFQRPTFRK